jgi:dipeptidyl aminopeptidase/acylaminoacyl peptidase
VTGSAVVGPATVRQSAQEKLMVRCLTPETLIYDLKGASDPQISPNGKRIAYTLGQATRDDARPGSQICLRDIDGGNARQLTFAGKRNGNPRWSPDGETIAFTSDRTDKSGIFLFPVDGGDPRELTRHQQAIGDLAWSPDGTQLAYTTTFDPENPDETPRPAGAPPRVRSTRRIDYKQDNRGYLNDVRQQIFVVDIATGERRMLTKEPVDHNYPQWSPGGKTIAAKIPNKNGLCSQLGLTDVATGETKLVGENDGVVGCWSWSPDGSEILIAADVAQTWQLDLFLYDVASCELRRLTDDLQVLPEAGFPTVSPPSQPVWLDDTRVLIHAIRAGTSGLYEFNVQTSEIKLQTGWKSMNAGFNVDRGRRCAAQTQSTLDGAGELVVYDIASKQSKVVTNHNADLFAEAKPAAWERFDVEQNGYTIEAWLLKPPGFDPSKRYPVVLDVHGGPHGYYGYSFAVVQQALAAAGFVVVYSNPRGSGSYGRDFAQQVIRDWGGEDFRDLHAVLDEAATRPFVDTERMGIYGYSYGGFMTAWTIGNSQRFKAAVCGAPVFNLMSFYGTADIGHVFGPLQCGGTPLEQEAYYEAHSPSTYAHNATTPTLIVHGEADDRCPIGQSEEMFVALLNAGCEVEYVRFPEGSHALMRTGYPAHRVEYLTRVIGWFKDHLGGAN